MNDQLYSVEMNEKTGEYHVFLSSKDKNKCKLKGSSLCDNMEYDRNAKNIGLCVNEKQLKGIIEKYNNKICKTCLNQINKIDEES